MCVCVFVHKPETKPNKQTKKKFIRNYNLIEVWVYFAIGYQQQQKRKRFYWPEATQIYNISNKQ